MTSLQQPTRARPQAIDRNADGTLSFSHPAGDLTRGGHVHIELQNPANSDPIYTVPANKTFTGTIVFIGKVPSGASIGVNAATGGSQATFAPTGATGDANVVTPVTIAGGGSGNSLTAAITGSPWGVSLIVDGYVK